MTDHRVGYPNPEPQVGERWQAWRVGADLDAITGVVQPARDSLHRICCLRDDSGVLHPIPIVGPGWIWKGPL